MKRCNNNSCRKRGCISAALILIAVIMAAGCLEIEKLPPEPRVEFRSFEISDTTDPLGNIAKAGKLTFYFEDGDGDLGISTGSSGPGDPADLFLKLFRKTDGKMAPAPPDDPMRPANYRIPYMERLGQNKILRGEITITILYNFFSESDTIMYEFYIKDRAENRSNTATTAEIPVYYNGIYK